MSAPARETPPPASRKRLIGLALIILLSLTGCVLVLSLGWLDGEALKHYVTDAGPSGMVVFIGLVVLMELLWLPRMWTLMASGALFGPFTAIGLSLVSDTLSAFICYGLARTTGRAYVEGLVAKRQRARDIMRVLADKRGGTTVAVLRVVPIAHFTLVSYLAGLTGVRPRVFLVGNTIGLLPSAILYATVGASALDPGSPIFMISTAVLIVAFVMTTIAGKKMLAQPSSEDEPT